MDQFSGVREIQAPAGFVGRVLQRVGLLDRYALVPTAIGETFVAAGSEGIVAVMQAASEAEFVRQYTERFGRRLERHDELAPSFAEALKAEDGDVPVDLRGCTPFQRDVLEATRGIAPGKVRSYAWIAERIGRPGAVRAVGTALAKNPIPLAIPCHRVVRSDGTIGDYAFGSGNKSSLLVSEGVDLDEVKRRMPLRSVWHAEGEDTFCHPFCYEARPLSLAENRITVFASVHDARAHGLQPCSSCSPSLAA